MKRGLQAGMVLALILLGTMGDRALAVLPVQTVDWIGGNAEWNTANAWKNRNTGAIGNATTLLLSNRGNEGMNTTSLLTTQARNIVIGDNADVTFNGAAVGDFRVRQGTNITINEGATWTQPTDGTYTENIWTRFDPSSLVLDNGAFRRTGVSPAGDGGGILMQSSFNDDNNISRLGSPRINVEMRNGSLLENNGQVWFGADDEHSPDTRVNWTISGGSTVNLTGGTIPLTNSTLSVDADLAFFYDYSEVLGRPKNEEYAITFKGPGSMVVDSAGINVYRQDSDSIWSGGSAVSYQDLWNQGILKAHGLSGQTGTVDTAGGTTARTPATFSDFFTTSGTPGADDYTLTSITTPIQTVKWIGGNAEWNTANAWQNTTTAAVGNATTLLGSNRGNEGMNTTNLATTAARDIEIGDNADVTFNGAAAGDFRVRQGMSITIKDGATWTQATDGTYTENIWTRFDPSNLILDNGSFRRTGQSPAGDGGGILMQSSFNDDNNITRLGSPRINVEIKNGGLLENNGQVWFGADDEHSPDTRVTWTINEGTVDLTGGNIPLTNSTLSVDADMAFFYDYSEVLGRPKNEEYSINFTGPGTITVDQAGINVYRQDSDSIWSGGSPVSYQDLWDQGILQAFGLSGKTGSVPTAGGTTALTPATFSDFFSVTGTPGSDNYILNSLIEATPDEETGDADYNNDGVIDAADYVAGRKLGLDLNLWQQQFGQSSPGGGGSGGGSGGVPEPGAMLLMVLGLASVSLSSRRSR